MQNLGTLRQPFLEEQWWRRRKERDKLGWAEPHSRFPLNFMKHRLPLKVVFHLRSSSIWGHLPIEVVFHLRSSSIRIVFHWRSCLPLEVVFHWRSSSIGGRLPLEVVFYWRSSFISSNIQFVFGPLSLNLKFEENLMSGCWDIQLLIFWGPLKVVFISSIFYFCLVLWA